MSSRVYLNSACPRASGLNTRLVLQRRDGLSKRIAIAGFGPVGRALEPLLTSRGDVVRVVKWNATRQAAVPVLARDLEVPEQAIDACADVHAVVCAVGVPYVSSVYQRLWPSIMRNLLSGCERSGARFIFADSLYMYGPQTRPLVEDMPLTHFGTKPRVRAEITQMWQQAHQAGRVRAVAVRASDFYGPDVETSVLSTYGVQRLITGKAMLAPYPPDNPHDFTYVPDFARALVTLIDASDDAYGQAWHVPNAPTQSLRQLLTLAAGLVGARPMIRVLPRALAPLIGLIKPEVRELAEMRFQWDRPYVVDAGKFAARFWSDATPFERGLADTIAWYRAHAHNSTPA